MGDMSEHFIGRIAAARLGFQTMKKEQEVVCRGKGCVCSPADRLWKQSLLLLPAVCVRQYPRWNRCVAVIVSPLLSPHE